MKILLTGASGFLGRIIYNELKEQHLITRLGRDEIFERKVDITKKFFLDERFDIVIHTAGLAHKRTGDFDEYLRVNLEGTKNLLNSLRNNPKTFIFISSVSVYGVSSGLNISESASLLGNTYYAKSKIDAEKEVIKWGKEKRVPSLILRLPLIIGENPRGNLLSIINAIKNGYYFRLGSGNYLKSVLYANDLAKFIPNLLGKEGVFNLTSGIPASICEIDTMISKRYKKNFIIIPNSLVSLMLKVENIIPNKNFHYFNKLTSTLTFDDSLAREKLGWNSKIDISKMNFLI